MAKLTKSRFYFLMVSLLLAVAANGALTSVYTKLEASLTAAEQEIQEEEWSRALYNGKSLTKEQLEGPLDEVLAKHNEDLNCATDDFVKENTKSQNKVTKEWRGEGGIKKIPNFTEVPTSSPCSASMKKLKGEMARNGGKIDGYSEGADGAQTQANLPGSVNQLALITQNKDTELAYIMQKRNEVGATFNRFCQENPDCESPVASSSWLLPVAMAQSTINQREFQVYLANSRAESATKLALAKRTSERVRQEAAAYDQFYQLSQAIQQIADKQQEVNAKAEIIKQAALQLEIKMDQAGPSHNCSSVAQLQPWWNFAKTENNCSHI